MDQTLLEISLPFNKSLEDYLQKKYGKNIHFRLISKILDARHAPKGRVPQFVYKVELLKNEQTIKEEKEEAEKTYSLSSPPIIIGMGPAGLFAALRFADYGIPSILLERGDPASERMKKIAAFWRYGKLDEESNVCYGEGGAGLYSDGKLMTRVKSPYIQYVMNRLVDFGAPPETAYRKDPHLGSNKIRTLITKISSYLKEKKCQLHYRTKVVDILFDENKKATGVRTEDGRTFHSPHIILATGHSADDIYKLMEEKNVACSAKPFSVGVRMEHPRKLINSIQFGSFAENEKSRDILGAAKYRLSYFNKESERGTYSFCMCPGGYVLSSGTQKNGLVVNGMSNYAHNSPWSNAALVVSVNLQEQKSDLFAGLKYQRSIEEKCFEYSKQVATGREIPAMSLLDFLEGKVSARQLPSSSCPSQTIKAPLHELFEKEVVLHLQEALLTFNRQMKGIIGKEGLLLAPETRTSSPLSILRHQETLESTSHTGLYPCGEGAGHAGGITSAAVDGIKVAMSILEKSV